MELGMRDFKTVPWRSGKETHPFFLMGKEEGLGLSKQNIFKSNLENTLWGTTGAFIMHDSLSASYLVTPLHSGLSAVPLHPPSS